MNNTESLSSRLYLLGLARYLLDNYDDTTETTNQNSTRRETEERERTRPRQRSGTNTRRRSNTTLFNTESVHFDSIAGGISRRFFPRLTSFYENARFLE